MKRITPKEFRELGLLHEVNRRILHPLGMALEVIIEDGSGNVKFGQVWDLRDDHEGMRFTELDQKSIDNVKAMEDKVRSTRINALGYWVQGEL